MYCTKCGTLAVADAKFCSKCGSPISEGISEIPDAVPSVTASVAKPRKISVIWLYIVGVLLLGTYAALFIPAFTGRSLIPQYGCGSLFWNSLFFYLLWKWRARKGWHGALVGAALGLLAFFVAGFIEGLIRGTTGH